MADAAPDESGEAMVRLTVVGMHCSSCVSLIEEVLLDVAGVASAQVDLESESGEVRFDPAAVSVDKLCDVISDLGYRATVGGPAARP